MIMLLGKENCAADIRDEATSDTNRFSVHSLVIPAPIYMYYLYLSLYLHPKKQVFCRCIRRHLKLTDYQY